MYRIKFTHDGEEKALVTSDKRELDGALTALDIIGYKIQKRESNPVVFEEVYFMENSDQKKEREICEIEKVIFDAFKRECGFPCTTVYASMLSEALYNSGYRKIDK